MAETVSADEFEEICGESFDHDVVIDYEDADGTQWHCRHCEVEVWEETETPTPAPSDQGSGG